MKCVVNKTIKAARSGPLSQLLGNQVTIRSFAAEDDNSSTRCLETSIG